MVMHEIILRRLIMPQELRTIAVIAVDRTPKGPPDDLHPNLSHH
jgi:hypothetical protein